MDGRSEFFPVDVQGERKNSTEEESDIEMGSVMNQNAIHSTAERNSPLEVQALLRIPV